ncbi:MAG: type II toxin-antitoxin system VapC family toxin [Gaiellaceae bacterium]
MRFWDASALVPMFIEDARTAAVQDLLDKDPVAGVWWGTEVECVSAMARHERVGAISGGDVQAAFDRLRRLVEEWVEVQPGEALRQAAVRLVRVHPLRAADALQLAAAIDASERSTAALPFVTLDNRLAEAARREGFSVLVPAAQAR